MKQADPTFLSIMTTFSFHLYWNTTASNAGILPRAQANGLKTGMSEFTTADIDTLFDNLKNQNVSFWQKYGISGLTDSPAQYVWADLANPATPRFIPTTIANLLQQVFAYVRMGAVRVDAVSVDEVNYGAVAFRNANNKYAVAVRNLGNKPISIKGLPAGTYGITYSSAGVTRAALADVTISAGGTISATNPAAGVITFFQR
jgi:hypothetical protein